MAFFRKNIIYFQLLISTIIVGYIFGKIDFNSFIKSLKSLNIYWLFASVVCFLISLILVPYKWHRILTFNQINYGFTTIFKVNLISSYYNQLMPSRIGGDSIKYFLLSKSDNINKVKITSSIIIDRGFNLIGIFLIAIISTILFEHDYFSNTLILISFGSFLFFLILVLSLPQIINDYLFKNKFIIITKMYVDIFKSMIKTFNQLMFIIIFSLAYGMVTFFMSYCIGQSLNIEASFSYYLTFLPIISLATILPISFSGFGIRESGFIYYLGILGVSNEKALALSLISFFITLILSFPGIFISNSFDNDSVRLNK
jgi:glycosyltransferase 2 family protein